MLKSSARHVSVVAHTLETINEFTILIGIILSMLAGIYVAEQGAITASFYVIFVGISFSILLRYAFKIFNILLKLASEIADDLRSLRINNIESNLEKENISAQD